MHRFFIEPENIDMDCGICRITGSDVKHIGNVLRMRQGEQLLRFEKDQIAQVRLYISFD